MPRNVDMIWVAANRFSFRVSTSTEFQMSVHICPNVIKRGLKELSSFPCQKLITEGGGGLESDKYPQEAEGTTGAGFVPDEAGGQGRHASTRSSTDYGAGALLLMNFKTGLRFLIDEALSPVTHPFYREVSSVQRTPQ